MELMALQAKLALPESTESNPDQPSMRKLVSMRMPASERRRLRMPKSLPRQSALI